MNDTAINMSIQVTM